MHTYKNHVLLGIIALLVGGVLWVTGTGVVSVSQSNEFSSNIPISEKRSGATLHIQFAEDDVRFFDDIELTTDATVFDILKSRAEQEGILLQFDPPGEWGVFVRQIGDKKNGENGKYWQYFVNEEFPLVAADKHALADGDRVRWIFAEADGER